MTDQVLMRQRTKRRLLEVGWNTEGILEDQLIYVDGRVAKLDIVLTHNLFPFAVIQVGRADASNVSGLDRAMEYAGALGVPFGFVTDGAAALGAGTSVSEFERHIAFPSPRELWSWLGRSWYKTDPRLFPPHSESRRAPTLQQVLAVAGALDAVMHGKHRVLVVMPAGPEMRYARFQLAWKLIRSGYSRHLLYLTGEPGGLALAEEELKPFGADLRLLSPGTTSVLNGTHPVHLTAASWFTHPEDWHLVVAAAPGFCDAVLVSDVHMTEQLTALLDSFGHAATVWFTSQELHSAATLQFFGQSASSCSLEATVNVSALSPPGDGGGPRL